ncbi:MAG: DUF4398 domain-containing protein [Balneolaceae bacterium]
MRKLILLTVVAVVMGACASTKPPSEKLTRVKSSIQQAEQVGADDFAPLEIREARKKLDQAQELVGKKKYEEAKLMADRAMVDADLAQIKTLSEKSQKAVNELRESIRVLKQEIQNNLNK